MESTFNMKEFFKNLKKRLPLIIAMTVANLMVVSCLMLMPRHWCRHSHGTREM